MLYHSNIDSLNRKIDKLYLQIMEGVGRRVSEEYRLLKEELFNSIVYHPIHSIWLKNCNISTLSTATLIHNRVCKKPTEPTEALSIFIESDNSYATSYHKAGLNKRLAESVIVKFLSDFSNMMSVLEDNECQFSETPYHLDNKLFLEYTNQNTNYKSSFTITNKITKALKDHDLSSTEISHLFSHNVSVKDALETLINQGKIRSYSNAKSGNRGRPATIYSLIDQKLKGPLKVSKNRDDPGSSNTLASIPDNHSSTDMYEYPASIYTTNRPHIRLRLPSSLLTPGLIGLFWNPKTSEIWIKILDKWEAGSFRAFLHRGKYKESTDISLNSICTEFNIEIAAQKIKARMVYKYDEEWIVCSPSITKTTPITPRSISVISTRLRAVPQENIPSFLEKIPNIPDRDGSSRHKEEAPLSKCKCEEDIEYPEVAHITRTQYRLHIPTSYLSPGLIGKWFNKETQEIWINIPRKWERDLWKMSLYVTVRKKEYSTTPLTTYHDRYNIDILPQKIKLKYIHRYGRDWIIFSVNEIDNKKEGAMDIFENIKNGVYEINTSELEKRAKYIICACETKYIVNADKTPKFCPECGRPVREKVEEAARQNKEIRDTYNKKAAELREQFKKDLFEYYDISDNPRREKAYSYCWDHGHGSGIYEVANIMADLVNLIK